MIIGGHTVHALRRDEGVANVTGLQGRVYFTPGWKSQRDRAPVAGRGRFDGGSLSCSKIQPLITLDRSATRMHDLKITDRGLVDVRRFTPVPLFSD